MKKGHVVHVAHKADLGEKTLKDIFFALDGGATSDAQFVSQGVEIEEGTRDENSL